jgi:hypothetical protein
MENGSSGTLHGLGYSIERRSGAACLICRAENRSLLFRGDEIHQAFGICEPCTLAAHWAWRQLSGESLPGLPGEDPGRVSTVFALVARRREVPRLDAVPGDGEASVLAPAELNSSWEFFLADVGDGIFSPPSISLDRQPDLRDLPKAAMSALAGVGLASWPSLAEPLFTGYSPRGRLVSVVLIRGWADISASSNSARPPEFDGSWLPWPLASHSGPMAGFWKALETVWSLRLHKHCVVEDSGELCVQLREAACRYIELRIALRSGKATDASMSAVYMSAMSADELAADRLIQLAEERAGGANRSLAVISRPPGGRDGEAVPSPSTRGSSVVPWDVPEGGEGQDDQAEETDPGDGDAEMDGDPDDQDDEERFWDGDESGDLEQEDPTFVRPRRPLKK